MSRLENEKKKKESIHLSYKGQLIQYILENKEIYISKMASKENSKCWRSLFMFFIFIIKIIL